MDVIQVDDYTVAPPTTSTTVGTGTTTPGQVERGHEFEHGGVEKRHGVTEEAAG